jgi:CheY-like chemotaxis protein
MAQHTNLKKILIVDDDALIRKIVRFHLRDHFHLEEADNGAKALTKAKENNFDAIIMDVSMKVMDGIEATKSLRKEPAYKTTPIIALTGFSFAQDKQNIFSAGYSHFLAKPFDKSDLLNLLDDVL